MAVETVHASSKVINPMAELGDLHIDILPVLGRARADYLCTHSTTRDDQAILDQRR